MKKTGFTLIELIIVIAVIAILATTVILVINPVNILREARDSQRIADLGQMSSAMGLYLATVVSPDLDGSGALDCPTDCFVNPAGVAANCGGRHAAARITTIITSRATDGTGWVPVNLAAISGGSPLSVWPVDPVNSATSFYSYACNNVAITYEFNAEMESTRYADGGSDDVESNDGGTVATVYEIGSEPGLDL